MEEKIKKIIRAMVIDKYREFREVLYEKLENQFTKDHIFFLYDEDYIMELIDEIICEI